MHKNIERLIGRLATDAALRERFVAEPGATVEALRADGYELTDLEREVLAALDGAALVRFADAIDRRLRKSAFIPATSKEETLR